MSASKFDPFLLPEAGRLKWNGYSRIFVKSLSNKNVINRMFYNNNDDEHGRSSLVIAIFTEDGSFCKYSSFYNVGRRILNAKAWYMLMAVFPYYGEFIGRYLILDAAILFQETAQWLIETKIGRNYHIIEKVNKSSRYECIDQSKDDIVLIGGGTFGIWFRNANDAMEFRLKFSGKFKIDVGASQLHKSITGISALFGSV